MKHIVDVVGLAHVLAEVGPVYTEKIFAWPRSKPAGIGQCLSHCLSQFARRSVQIAAPDRFNQTNFVAISSSADPQSLGIAQRVMQRVMRVTVFPQVPEAP